MAQMPLSMYSPPCRPRSAPAASAGCSAAGPTVSMSNARQCTYNARRHEHGGNDVTQHTVGVIGVGNMGAGIARNIARKGQAVVAWDAVSAARERIAGEPGIAVAPPAAMAARCAA
ncbi:MAG: hypothetical protein FJX53_02375, partial [Alphaproteobacteria bacterium]|nr:hypothetical protein [Alphaproteobacteria bacterium]